MKIKRLAILPLAILTSCSGDYDPNAFNSVGSPSWSNTNSAWNNAYEAKMERKRQGNNAAARRTTNPYIQHQSR